MHHGEIFTWKLTDYRAKGRLFSHCACYHDETFTKKMTLYKIMHSEVTKYFFHYFFVFKNTATPGAFPGALTLGKRYKGV